MAHVLRQVEADATLKPGERYRLLINGAAELRALIIAVEEHGEVEQQLADLERRYAEIAS